MSNSSLTARQRGKEISTTSLLQWLPFRTFTLIRCRKRSAVHGIHIGMSMQRRVAGGPPGLRDCWILAAVRESRPYASHTPVIM